MYFNSSKKLKGDIVFMITNFTYGIDKWLHLIISILLVVVISKFSNIQIALLITIGLGIFKEILDIGRQSCDIWDIAFDYIGILIGYMLVCF